MRAKTLPADDHPHAEMIAFRARGLGQNGPSGLSNAASVAATTENGGRLRPVGDKNVPRIKKRAFARVARVLWPTKTAAAIAAIAGVDERTGKRWLEGRGDPPIEIAIACLQKIFSEQA